MANFQGMTHDSWVMSQGVEWDFFLKKKVLRSCDATMDDNWNVSGGFNRCQVGVPRHDITKYLVSDQIQIFEFKVDQIENSEWWQKRFFGKVFTQKSFLRFRAATRGICRKLPSDKFLKYFFRWHEIWLEIFFENPMEIVSGICKYHMKMARLRLYSQTLKNFPIFKNCFVHLTKSQKWLH